MPKIKETDSNIPSCIVTYLNTFMATAFLVCFTKYGITMGLELHVVKQKITPIRRLGLFRGELL